MTYDEGFFVDEGRVARESAAVVMPYVTSRTLPPCLDTRIVDIGCGTGEWAYSVWTHDNIVLGLDLHAPNETHIPRLYLDISQGIDCTGWDLAICLEVAEHLPAESAIPLVAGLAKADTVLWSAATPGQPGVDHVNCQPPEYWEGLFNQHGMTGEYIGHNFSEPVADFYCRNLWLYRKTV